MARAMAVLTLGLLTALPATAGASSLQIRLGGFFPRAESNLFFDDSQLYTVVKDDWQGFTGGAEFSINPAPHIEVGFHVDGYGQHVDTFYRDYTRPDGREILQTLHLDIVPVGATIRFFPTDRYAAVAPYVGVGGGLFFYQYEEFGDFVDFQSPNLDIVSDHFRSDGVTGGLHATAGLRVRVGHDFSVFGEGRYQWGEAKLEDDFRPQPGQDQLRLDLSGYSIVGGVSIRF